MAVYIKEFILYSSLLLVIFFASFSEADAQEQDFYFGLSGGQTRVKNTQTQEYQDATSFGAKVGMRLYSSESIWTGTELKYTRTTAKETVSDSGSSSVSTYEVETTGLYLTGRSRGKVYAKGKIGAAHHIIQVDDVVIQETTRGSAGVGLGIRQGGAVLEVEYTLYGDDVTILSIGYVF